MVLERRKPLSRDILNLEMWIISLNIYLEFHEIKKKAENINITEFLDEHTHNLELSNWM